jgi:hypothetical protein
MIIKYISRVMQKYISLLLMNVIYLDEQHFIQSRKRSICMLQIGIMNTM